MVFEEEDGGEWRPARLCVSTIDLHTTRDRELLVVVWLYQATYAGEGEEVVECFMVMLCGCVVVCG